MARGLQQLLDWMWGTRGVPPAPPGATPRASAQAGQTPMIEYRGHDQRPSVSTPTEMRYHKEHVRMPTVRVSRWGSATPRQRFLVMLAGLSLASMVVAWAATFTGSRVLPAEIQGLYATDDSLYASRRFELQAHRLAFTTSDTIRAVVGRPIRLVRHSLDAHGTRYDVEYQEEDGGSHQISFIVLDGATPELKFVNQPRLIWRRVSTGQTIMRQIY